MNQDFRDLLREFVDAEVRFLVVGAYALAIHGRPRATGDLDLWDPTPSNAERVYQSLQRFGAPLTDLSVADLATSGVVYQMGVAPWRIDILTNIDGVTFNEAWPRRARGVYQDVTFPVIGRADLLRNKRATGRPKDEVDAQLLEAGDAMDPLE
jgi:hypothetical protein